MKFSAQSAEVLFNSDEDNPDRGTILEKTTGDLADYSIESGSQSEPPEKGNKK